MKKVQKISLATICFMGTALCASNEIVQSHNAFACNMYHQLGTSTNTFFSPYSIASALSAAYAGAQGITEKEMATVLCTDQLQNIYHVHCGNIVDNLNQENEKYNLEVANKLFVKVGHTLADTFKTRMQPYGAAVQSIDFGDAQYASDTINGWVKEKTREKIKDIVNPDMFDDLTYMAIVNAIYFKGSWEKKFNERLTTKLPFYLNGDNNTSVSADMMQQTNSFKYMENDAFKMIELPYEGDRFSMFAMLPKGEVKLENMKKDLSITTLNNATTKLQEKEVRLMLPKFKMESEYDLEKTLKQLGMSSAFGKGANFSGIFDGSEDPCISAVVHKAFIEVDEKGSEAAAATAIIIRAKECCMYSEDPVEFRADKPFVFFIKDKKTNVITFLGNVDNPNA